jgi:hypothetical protein
MIKIEEYRAGNTVLQKINTRIIPAVLALQHFATIASGNTKDFFPLVLSPEVFLKAGFLENKDYALLPEAREFLLMLPVNSPNETLIQGYMKNNKDCFARLVVNKLVASNPLYHLHQVQNLYYSLTGAELSIKM